MDATIASFPCWCFSIWRKGVILNISSPIYSILNFFNGLAMQPVFHLWPGAYLGQQQSSEGQSNFFLSECFLINAGLIECVYRWDRHCRITCRNVGVYRRPFCTCWFECPSGFERLKMMIQAYPKRENVAGWRLHANNEAFQSSCGRQRLGFNAILGAVLQDLSSTLSNWRPGFA